MSKALFDLGSYELRAEHKELLVEMSKRSSPTTVQKSLVGRFGYDPDPRKTFHLYKYGVDQDLPNLDPQS